MKRLVVVFSIAALLVISLLGGIALGQGGGEGDVLARLQPLLVRVQQSVPMSVTLGVQVSATETLTVTVPAVVDVDVSIRLDSTMTPVVEAKPAGPALVTVSDLLAAGEPLIDNNGVPYEVEVPDGIEIVQWLTDWDFADDWSALGELRNVDEAKSLSSLFFYVTLYDADGVMLESSLGVMSMDNVEPGGTSPFDVMSSTQFEDVARYLVQVEARFER